MLTPGIHRVAVAVQQHRIVVVLVLVLVDGVPMLAGREPVKVDLSHQPKLSGPHGGGPEVEPQPELAARAVGQSWSRSPFTRLTKLA